MKLTEGLLDLLQLQPLRLRDAEAHVDEGHDAQPREDSKGGGGADGGEFLGEDQSDDKVPEEVLLHRKRDCTTANLQREYLRHHQPRDRPEPNLVSADVREHTDQNQHLTPSDVTVRAAGAAGGGVTVIGADEQKGEQPKRHRHDTDTQEQQEAPSLVLHKQYREHRRDELEGTDQDRGVVSEPGVLEDGVRVVQHRRLPGELLQEHQPAPGQQRRPVLPLEHTGEPRLRLPLGPLLRLDVLLDLLQRQLRALLLVGQQQRPHHLLVRPPAEAQPPGGRGEEENPHKEHQSEGHSDAVSPLPPTGRVLEEETEGVACEDAEHNASFFHRNQLSPHSRRRHLPNVGGDTVHSEPAPETVDPRTPRGEHSNQRPVPARQRTTPLLSEYTCWSFLHTRPVSYPHPAYRQGFRPPPSLPRGGSGWARSWLLLFEAS
eukprot:Hpha_TRINITY_DN15844_c1_g1::TRINITY_DN15844_c1_g1_i3::g.187231::m.187231